MPKFVAFTSLGRRALAQSVRPFRARLHLRRPRRDRPRQQGRDDAAARRRARPTSISDRSSTCPITRCARPCACSSRWGSRSSSPSPMRRSPQRAGAPSGADPASSTCCNRCRSSASWRSSCRCSSSASVPGSVLGYESACIFAIFTSQAWNMAFSFYQSLRNVPGDLIEVSRGFNLTPWQRFWQLETPFAMPGLVWNMMMSMSGGWFFVVASEAIAVGSDTTKLPGIGSYIDLANSRSDWGAIIAAVAMMGDRHPRLRPAPVPPARRVLGALPRRTRRQPAAGTLLGHRPRSGARAGCGR